MVPLPTLLPALGRSICSVVISSLIWTWHPYLYGHTATWKPFRSPPPHFRCARDLPSLLPLVGTFPGPHFSTMFLSYRDWTVIDCLHVLQSEWKLTKVQSLPSRNDIFGSTERNEVKHSQSTNVSCSFCMILFIDSHTLEEKWLVCAETQIK